MNLLLTVVIIFLVVRHYVIKLNFLKNRGIVDHDTKLYDAVPLRYWLLLEIIILLIISPPGTEARQTFSQFN